MTPQRGFTRAPFTKREAATRWPVRRCVLMWCAISAVVWAAILGAVANA